jgi:hypothetical protein
LAQQNKRYKEILDQTTYSQAIKNKRKNAIASMRKVTMDSTEFYDLALKQRKIMEDLDTFCDAGSGA